MEGAGNTGGAGSPAPNATVVTPPGAGNTTGTATQFSVPSGYRLVAQDEYERHLNTLRGSGQYVERGRKSGFEKPEDFDAWGQTIDTLKQRGIDWRHLPRIFENDQANGQANGTQTPDFDPDSFKKELKSEWAREQAEREYEASEKAAFDALPKHVRELLGEDAVDADVELHRLAALGHYYNGVFGSKVERFENGHPLYATHAKPPSLDSIKGSIAELRKQAEAQRLARKGAAAAKPNPSGTASGNAAGQGKPQNESKTSPFDRPKSDKAADMASRIAKFQGGARPLSR